MTLYDILGLLPGASADKIRKAYQARMRQLGPDMIAGASSKVLAAVNRAQAAAEQAWRVLGDPASRARYDLQAGLRSAGGGLDRPMAVPTESSWSPPSPVMLRGAGEIAGVLAALDTLAEWLAPHPRPSRYVLVPDVRGLFAGPCQYAAGAAGLRLETVQLTAHPMPVEGLIVEQSPPPGTKVRRSAALTVRVWHPAARPAVL
jgi:hypothetical protein